MHGIKSAAFRGQFSFFYTEVVIETWRSKVKYEWQTSPRHTAYSELLDVESKSTYRCARCRVGQVGSQVVVHLMVSHWRHCAPANTNNSTLFTYHPRTVVDPHWQSATAMPAPHTTGNAYPAPHATRRTRKQLRSTCHQREQS